MWQYSSNLLTSKKLWHTKLEVVDVKRTWDRDETTLTGIAWSSAERTAVKDTNFQTPLFCPLILSKYFYTDEPSGAQCVRPRNCRDVGSNTTCSKDLCVCLSSYLQLKRSETWPDLTSQKGAPARWRCVLRTVSSVSWNIPSSPRSNIRSLFLPINFCISER
jgi:hypothetical protein